MANRIDAHGETWTAIRAWAEQRRMLATSSLVQGGTTPGHDDKLRGEIRALNDLLALADDTQPPVTPPITY